MGFERRDRGDRGERRGFGSRGGFGRREGGFGGRRFGGGGFHRENENFGLPKPVKVGEEYNVKINDVGAKGDGITKVKGFIIFVPNAKKDDELKIRIKEVANRFAIADNVGPADGPLYTETEEKKSNEPSEESERGESDSEEKQESENSEEETELPEEETEESEE